MWLTQPRMQWQWTHGQSASISVWHMLAITVVVDMMFRGGTLDLACHIGGFAFGYLYVCTPPQIITLSWERVGPTVLDRMIKMDLGLDKRSAFMCAGAMLYALVVVVLCVVTGDGAEYNEVREMRQRKVRRRRRVVNGILIE